MKRYFGRTATIVGSVYLFLVVAVLAVEIERVVTAEGPIGFPGILLFFVTCPTSYLTNALMLLPVPGFDSVTALFAFSTLAGMVQAFALAFIVERLARMFRRPRQKAG
ncbi:SCO4225 family membrane protein [Salininema proteolyticum]|uniref:SCO4225 family membrane protein n=1 Tax=Salininema proteolyticum TaxID=1607685 RepID=A0ABV8U4J8_9ACTN